MQLYIPLISTLAVYYVKCPRCGKIQHFEGKKKGDAVVCKECGYEFRLK
ncbi:MAG: hypothetical protein ACOYW7_07890 [Nitrospirota bacterium]